ncbi:MAG: valine--tRNA ligase [Candidatus Eisenbacteria bacterium]|nr:valine--tRNA ligase [Candidatus Eisenbacteria bacterium]
MAVSTEKELMATELPKIYDPSAVEKRWQEFWEKNDVFRTDEGSGKEPFVILIPPPNVTGVLHMGHVLTYTIQDIVIRFRRMQGREALWLPGMDHAGIATQNVVEKMLRKEGKSRHDLGRDAFVKHVWDWKERHGGRIFQQFRRLGASFDMNRFVFTLDESYSRAVVRVFVSLYEKGLIYRGNYIAGWCPRCHTVLSDEEVDHHERKGRLWYVRYPLEGGGGDLTVATTRPETMLGDSGIAIHPDSERTRHLKGKRAVLPLVGRSLPIVEDERVDPEFGTGCVKVTPAHDPLDFELGKTHGLEEIRILKEDATVVEGYGAYSGLSREEARKAIVRDLEEQGYLVKTEDHRHAVGRCYRCDTDVEPWLSTQWFVSMKRLAEPALDAVRDGRVEIFPDRWRKVYFHWMENIRDWCVSRQLWWGHRIPAYHCVDCGHVMVREERPERCSQCASSNLNQDPDVLDTWFSSWLWPFATLGWPDREKRLETFFPSHLMVTGSEILFFWVARMIMSSIEFLGEPPFAKVYLHGIVRDKKGRKLSKSLGNSPDPIDVLDRVGADAVRFATILNTPPGQDQIFSEENLETGRRFANKIWNAARFALPHLEGVKDANRDPAGLDLPERWIRSRLTAAQRAATEHLEATRLNEAAYAVYDFFWHELCDWYLEMSKGALFGEGEDAPVRETLLRVLREGVLLLAPFLPHLAEELGERLGIDAPCVSVARWNDGAEGFRDEAAEREMAAVAELVTSVRTLRSESNIPPKEEVPVAVRFLDESVRDAVERYGDLARGLARIGSLELGVAERPKGSVAHVTGALEVFLPLAGLVDIDKERQRLAKEEERLGRELEKTARKLMNKEYLSKAPPEVVEKDRDRERRFAEMRGRVRENLRGLSE